MNLNGTQTVSPSNSTNFHLTAKGDGGTTEANVRVTVRVPVAPSAPAPENVDMGSEAAFHQNVQDIFFDYDSYDLRPDAATSTAKAAEYLTAHPTIKVVIGGYCDDRGSAEYNLALGENRANAARTALISAGVACQPPPRHQLRQREAVLHRRERELLAAEPASPVLSRSLILTVSLRPGPQAAHNARAEPEDRKPERATAMNIQSAHPAKPTAKSRPFVAAALLAVAALCCASPAFAVSKDMVQLQTQIQQLQDAVARLQQSNDERMGVMKDLIQQSADSINKMSAVVESLQKQMQAQQEAQTGKIDQLSGQIQSLNDSVDEIKARIGSLQKLVQDVQSQQQSMSANMQNEPGGGGSSSSAPVNPVPDTPPPPSSHRPQEANPPPTFRLAACPAHARRRNSGGAPQPTSSTRPRSATIWPRNTPLLPPSSAMSSRTTPTIRSQETPTTTRPRSTIAEANTPPPSRPTTPSSTSIPTATRFPSRIFTRAWRWSR